MKEIILFISGAVMALLVPTDVSDSLRRAVVNLVVFVSHARQAADAAPPESGEITLPAGEAAGAPQHARAEAPTGVQVPAAPGIAARDEHDNSPDYVSAEEAAEIMRAFKGYGPGSD
jgi:hypothetical protein